MSSYGTVQKVKPCPFCGVDRPYVHDSHVECLNCGVQGPFAESADLAVEYWNERSIPSEQ